MKQCSATEQLEELSALQRVNLAMKPPPALIETSSSYLSSSSTLDDDGRRIVEVVSGDYRLIGPLAQERQRHPCGPGGRAVHRRDEPGCPAPAREERDLADLDGGSTRVSSHTRGMLLMI